MVETRSDWEFVVGVVACYLLLITNGGWVVFIMEMANPVALRWELTTAAIVSWLVGLTVFYIVSLFLEATNPGSLKVPRKGRRLLFAAFWPVMIWKVQVVQTSHPTGVEG